MTNDLESGLNQLTELRQRYAATNAAIIENRNTVARCHREVAEARVAAVLDSEANSPKVTEAKVKRLDTERATAEAAIQKLSPEAAALCGAIAKLESEVMPRRHKARLGRQAELQTKYRDVARRLLDAANALSAVTGEADSLYQSACSEFPKDELFAGQDVVRSAAGLQAISDPQWVDHGDGTRRDIAIGNLWEFDLTLVPTADPVAIRKRHQADFFAQLRAEHESKRERMLNPPPPPPPAPRRKMTVSELNRGEWLDPNCTVVRVRS